MCEVPFHTFTLRAALILTPSAKGRAPTPQTPGPEVPGPVLDSGLQVAPALTSLPVNGTVSSTSFSNVPLTSALCTVTTDSSPPHNVSALPPISCHKAFTRNSENVTARVWLHLQVTRGFTRIVILEKKVTNSVSTDWRLPHGAQYPAEQMVPKRVLRFSTEHISSLSSHTSPSKHVFPFSR